jgi:signal peptide peptidase-like protein 2B
LIFNSIFQFSKTALAENTVRLTERHSIFPTRLQPLPTTMTAYFKTFRAVALLLLIHSQGVVSVLQTGAIDVYLGEAATTSYSLFVSQASFGETPAMGADKNPNRVLATAPANNPLLCDSVADARVAAGAADIIMIVPRGECTFEIKARNAQRLGAKAMLVYGALSSRYSLNKTLHANDTDYEYTYNDIVFPGDRFDYDCSYGRALIPASAVSFDPLPYNSTQNDPVLSGVTAQNLCLKYSTDKLQNCPSQACLLTGKNEEDNTQLEACCAWDLPIWLYLDTDFDEDADAAVTIPAAYVTLEQGEKLLKDMQENQQVRIVLYTRSRQSSNFSSILIWALGVFVASLAAYLSAGDYRKMTRRANRRSERNAQGRSHDESSGGESSQQRLAPQEDTLELAPVHAVGFVFVASFSLLFLFYFKIYNIVKVMYAFGCSKSVSQVLFYPLLKKPMKGFGIRDQIVWRTGTEDFGDITIRDIVSHVCGYSIGITWIIMAFAYRHPEEKAFFWIVQDVFGACMCVMFAKVIKLNSIHVASILLIAAFCYDIFFVFITPILFNGKSVMIDVATSGGAPTADPGWCEKYPDDADCQGGDPLPMLLTVPKFWDYQGGASLLGLGDIVLPGLLLSFAARFDNAKALLATLGGRNGVRSKILGTYGGYFPPLVVAYAVGLMMANVAVSVMHMGQPALLYLVPCCLGTMSFMGYRRNELKDLWDGPKCLLAADAVVYGEHPSDAHSPVPMEEGHNALAVPSAENDERDDLPLLEVNKA